MRIGVVAAIIVAWLTACGDPGSVVRAPEIAPRSAPTPTAAAEPMPDIEVTVADQVADSSAATTSPLAVTPTVPSTPTPVPIEEINFAGVVTGTNLPSQMQVVFSLRDQQGHAVVVPAEQIEQSTRVFEFGPGTDGWEEIDYTETSFFIHTAENIDLEVVFVLDFTNSMAHARLPDGRSGIEAMLGAFDSALAVLPAAHRVGVVEFHDRNTDPKVLFGLTTDRRAVRESVARFSQSDFDPGSSRVWDSVISASNLFSTRSENPRAVRALVFLSDGRDTSSVTQRETAGQYALDRGVQLYAMGVGEVLQEARLRQMAESTIGAYYEVRDVALLQEQLQLLVNDLRGQYQLTYITLRRTGVYETAIEVDLWGLNARAQIGPFDAAEFFGADNQGVIELDPPSLAVDGEVTVFLRTLHVPRNIDRIRFKADTSKPISVELVAKRDGGLLEEWTLSGPDADGFHDASSQDPIEFGNLGLLFKLTISDVTERSLNIPFEFDDTIYTEDKSLGGTVHLITDPTKIAFSSAAGYFTIDPYVYFLMGDIYVMNSSGSGVTQLTHHPSTDRPEGASFPAWSPDGGRIAFSSSRSGDESWHIYVMNADGSEVTQLSDYYGLDVSPTWSPDGSRIAFSSYRSRDEGWAIYIMNADGSEVTRLTDYSGQDVSPAWSPDGSRIAFSSYRSGDEGRAIYVMNPDGSGVTRLTDYPGHEVAPAWSPDGRQIAFAADVGVYDDSGNIYVMNADGSGVTRLTNHPSDHGLPAWSSDGRQIAFYSDRDGDWDIYVMNADGSGVRQLTDNPEWDGYPAWSP